MNEKSENGAQYQIRKCRSPPPLNFAPIPLEDVQCAETNDKSISRFFRISFSSYNIVTYNIVHQAIDDKQ